MIAIKDIVNVAGIVIPKDKVIFLMTLKDWNHLGEIQLLLCLPTFGDL